MAVVQRTPIGLAEPAKLSAKSARCNLPHADGEGGAAISPTTHTHTSRAGAELNADCVIEGLKALEKNPLAAYLR